MTQLAEAFGLVAPFYNLGLVVIVGMMLWRLFQMKNKGAFLTPWKLISVMLFVFVIESFFTVLFFLDVVKIPRITNAVFEMIIITIMIYALLLQKEHVFHVHERKKKK